MRGSLRGLCSMHVLLTGDTPAPCHSHAAAVMQNSMYVFGGTRDYQQHLSGPHALDLSSGRWEAITPAASLRRPPSCFSHSLTAVGGLLVLAGGCHTLGAGQQHCISRKAIHTGLQICKCCPSACTCCVEHTICRATSGQLQGLLPLPGASWGQLGSQDPLPGQAGFIAYSHIFLPIIAALCCAG